jgi:integrase
MSVFKNPNGLWYARISTGVKGPNGRYKYVTSKHGRKSRGDALMDEAELRVFVAGNNADALSKIRNHELLDRYMATKGIRATTAKTYKSAIAHIKKLLPDMPARDTTTMHMEAFRQAVLMEPVSTTTHRTYISLVKAAFRWAADNDMIIKSPARNLKLPEKTEPVGMHVPINILQEILQQVKTYRYSQLYIPLLLAGMCGLRISEICGLQDTDVTSKHIQVRFNFLRAGKDLSLQPLKTKAAARVVPVIADVAREINEYRRFIARCKETAVSQRMELEKQPNFLDGDPAWQESGHFFVHPQDGRPLGREYVERQWKQFKRSPEMLPLIRKYPELANMRLHDFRHSFGSNLRYAGAPIEDVTEILGHTDSNFTRTTYALPLQGTHERSMKRLETLMKNIVN